MDDIENLYLILAFLVPGFISLFIRSQFLTGRLPTFQESSIAYFILTLVYYGLVFPLLEMALKFDGSNWAWAGIWFLIIFVGPVFLGVLLGLNSRLELFRKLLNKLEINPVHAIPTAWDWKFGNLKREWVLIVLKDGTKFCGLCSSNSFISSDPNERDIYIERTFDLEDDGTWTPRENSVLIMCGEIRTIEFWPYNERETNEQRKGNTTGSTG